MKSPTKKTLSPPFTPPGLVQTFRGPFLENSHAVSVAIVAPDGRLLASCGDPATPMVLRSTAKPFQALALFHTGANDHWAVTPEELALACSSHDATERHVVGVQRLLERLGLEESALGCGPHAPGHVPSADALIRADETPRSIHNNCSGKHSGMLASCLYAGWDIRNYLDPDHPLQRSIHGTLERLSGGPVAAGGVDGCSAPTFTLPLSKVAKLYALLAAPTSAPPQDAAGLACAYEAMHTFPDLVAGPTTIDTLLMAAYPDIVCKRGAAGGYGIAARGTKHGDLGIAIWVHDGANDARAATILSVLEQLELSPNTSKALDALRDRFLVRRNCLNKAVGHLLSHVPLDLPLQPQAL